MRFLYLLTALLVASSSFAQKKTEFLPKGHLFEPILLDPLEAKASASIVRRSQEGESQDGVFAPFSIGFQKGFVRWNRDEQYASELALDVVANTQFEMFHDSRENRFRRYLFNVDYRVGLLYNVKRGANSWRFRIYHLSSHLGDDYLIRQNLNYYLPNPVNYEQADALYSHQGRSVRWYGGAGIGLRPASERKRLYAQTGFVWKQPNREKARWWGGVDARMIEETEFHPGVSAAFGIELGAADRNPVSLALQFFHGPLPYSVFERKINTWAGAGFYLNPF